MAEKKRKTPAFGVVYQSKREPVITVERIFPSGMLVATARIADDTLVKNKYMGYPLREAVSDFREQVTEAERNIITEQRA